MRVTKSGTKSGTESGLAERLIKKVLNLDTSLKPIVLSGLANLVYENKIPLELLSLEFYRKVLVLNLSPDSKNTRLQQEAERLFRSLVKMRITFRNEVIGYLSLDKSNTDSFSFRGSSARVSMLRFLIRLEKEYNLPQIFLTDSPLCSSVIGLIDDVNADVKASALDFLSSPMVAFYIPQDLLTADFYKKLISECVDDARSLDLVCINSLRLLTTLILEQKVPQDLLTADFYSTVRRYIDDPVMGKNALKILAEHANKDSAFCEEFCNDLKQQLAAATNDETKVTALQLLTRLIKPGEIPKSICDAAFYKEVFALIDYSDTSIKTTALNLAAKLAMQYDKDTAEGLPVVEEFCRKAIGLLCETPLFFLTPSFFLKIFSFNGNDENLNVKRMALSSLAGFAKNDNIPLDILTPDFYSKVVHLLIDGNNIDPQNQRGKDYDSKPLKKKAPFYSEVLGLLFELVNKFQIYQDIFTEEFYTKAILLVDCYGHLDSSCRVSTIELLGELEKKDDFFYDKVLAVLNKVEEWSKQEPLNEKERQGLFSILTLESRICRMQLNVVSMLSRIAEFRENREMAKLPENPDFYAKLIGFLDGGRELRVPTLSLFMQMQLEGVIHLHLLTGGFYINLIRFADDKFDRYRDPRLFLMRLVMKDIDFCSKVRRCLEEDDTDPLVKKAVVDFLQRLLQQDNIRSCYDLRQMLLINFSDGNLYEAVDSSLST
jgi:hypothetical protein